MRFDRLLVPAGALAIVIGAGGFSAAVAQERGESRDRGARQSQGQGQARVRSGDNRGARDQHNDGRDQRNGAPTEGHYDARGSQPGLAYRGNNYGYVQPRVVVPYRAVPYQAVPYQAVPYQAVPYRAVPYRAVPYRVPPRHYYGPGGNFSVYFGWGSGYRYGSPYSGRVYGYSAAPVYGARRYYGDVRLLVRPREAAVYVDGYYAGIVDDFDGVFQRLTLDVGPHEIEIEAPGFAPQTFNVYVDPTRTVDLHGDLFPDHP